MAAQILQRERYHTCYYCKLADHMLPAAVVGIFQCREATIREVQT